MTSSGRRHHPATVVLVLVALALTAWALFTLLGVLIIWFAVIALSALGR